MTKKSKDCPICLDEVEINKFCHGCEHEFCFECISSWVTQHSARCPLCNSDVYGIYSQDSSFYLTPHYGVFGMELKKNGDYTQVKNVIQGGLAEFYLQQGDIIKVNEKYVYHECMKELEYAKKKKTMLKVEQIKFESQEEQHQETKCSRRGCFFCRCC